MDSIRRVEFTGEPPELRDLVGADAGMKAAAKTAELHKGPTMKTLDLDTLSHVTGGLSSTAALTQSLTTIQSSLSSLATNNNNNQSSSLLPVMMAVAMSRRW